MAVGNHGLKALILAGGKSRRMGFDKSQIAYHREKPHELYTADLCADLGLETFISKGSDEVASHIEGYQIIKDFEYDKGPLAAIYSAMMSDKHAAWLVLACDLPFIDKMPIQKLISSRSDKYDITALQVSNRPFPEPLIAIYEPRLRIKVKEQLASGLLGPRKLLEVCEVQTVFIENEKVALNINSDLERKQWKDK